jgi:hypothetical protein
MRSGEDSQLRPLASQPLSRKIAPNRGGHAGNRPSGRAGARPAQSTPVPSRRNHVISKEGQHSEISNIVCEIFEEEISCEPQARKFLWEFFD